MQCHPQVTQGGLPPKSRHSEHMSSVYPIQGEYQKKMSKLPATGAEAARLTSR